MIYYGCPACGTAMASPDSMAGQTEACPECGNVATVPAPAAVPVAQPLPMAARPQVVEVRTPAAKSTSGLGIAGLVLGIIACLTAWIPIVGVVSIPLSVLGLLFGGIGLLLALVGRRSGVGMPVAAVVVTLVALGLQVFWIGAIASGPVASARQAAREAIARAEAQQQAAADVEAYVPLVELRSVWAGEANGGGTGVFGEVRNGGDRALSRVEVQIRCLAPDGRLLHEQQYCPVGASAASPGGGGRLDPSDVRAWGCLLDGAPAGWAGPVDVSVTAVEFTK